MRITDGIQPTDKPKSRIFSPQNNKTVNDFKRPKSIGLDASNPTIKKPIGERNKTPSKLVHKTKQPSHTLMRRAVKKPSTITDRKTTAMDVVPHAPGQTMAKVFHTPVVERLERARSVQKLPLISRFGDISTSIRKPVFKAKTPQPDSISQTKQLIDISKEAPKLAQAASNALPASKASQLLDKGLRAANSHDQHPVSKPKLRHRIGKRLGMSGRSTRNVAIALTVLSMGSFFAYQNVPNLNVRYAAAKAGVSGVLPAYQPAGFAVNSHVKYAPGAITIAYKANADERSYTITQANTTWSSDALKDHLVSASTTQLQVYPQKGQTIYLHDGAKADWVSNGIWYSISGDSSLNTDQLIKIASSI